MAGRLARFGGWRVDVETDAVTWSDQAAAIHDEPAGTCPTVEGGLSYYVSEHRPAIETAFRQCASHGDPFDLSLQIVTRAGRRIWVRTAGEAVRNPAGRIVEVRGAFQDIDELVHAQQALRLSETRLSSVLDRIDEGFLLLSRDNHVIFLNAAGKRLLGVADDMIGRTLWDALPDGGSSPFLHGFEAALATGEPTHFEALYAPLDIHLEVGAYPLQGGLTARFQDITPRRRAESELSSSEERFRLVAAVTNDLIWDWDVGSDQAWFSDRLADFGYPPSEGHSSQFWMDRIDPVDAERVKASLFAAMASEAEDWSDEYGFLKADGSIARVIDRALILRDATGRPHRLIGSMMDITARILVERQLREAQKLEAVGQLTGGVAHDFNNLLTVIIGTAESLSERVSDDAESLMLADMTKAAAERGAELTSRLLAFARRQPLAPRPTDLGRLLASLDGMLRRTLSEQIDLEMVGGGGLLSALVDPGQLETAILNLAINARDPCRTAGA